MVEWLVVGLGNPGEEYAQSPHNIGFMVVDRLAEGCGARVKRKDSRALAGQTAVGGTPVLLAKPQTYMNLSGEAVKGGRQAFEISPPVEARWLKLVILSNYGEPSYTELGVFSVMWSEHCSSHPTLPAGRYCQRERPGCCRGMRVRCPPAESG